MHTPNPVACVPYRAEVDGLRAVAVIPVILFHAGVAHMAGGFVGVDVFFVISGYLITSIILAELAQQRFSLVSFYERRARRILPPLLLMMAACLPLAWLWLDPISLKGFAKSLVAVPFFSSNALFWMESGYFDAGVDAKPLIHTWTLALEEQYYVLFPLLLMLGWRVGRRTLLPLLGLLAVASLALAEHGAQLASSAAFYLLPGRAWELLVGSLLAFWFSAHPRRVPAAGWHHEAGGLLGLGLIGFAVFSYGKATPFPGLHALVPTMGAALVITCTSAKTLAGRWLASRPLVAVGLVSYSAYLWHQPLFALARNRSLLPPSLSFMLGLAALSLLLAWLSWRFIETPFRDKQRVSRRQIFTGSALASLLFVGLGLAGYQQQGFPQRYDIDPAMLKAFEDPTIRTACDRGYDGSGFGIGLCFFGAPAGADGAAVAVFGDSHSEALLPAFAELGERLGLSVVHLGVGGCPPLLGVAVAAGNYARGACETLAQRQFDYVKAHGIRHVVLVARWSLYTDGGYEGERKVRYFLVDAQHMAQDQATSRQVFRAGVQRTVEAYRALGVQVDVLAQAPQQLASPRTVYYRLAHVGQSDAQKLQTVQALSVPYGAHQRLQQFNRGVFETMASTGQVRLFDLDGVFCDTRRCLLGDPQQSWYKDNDHLNGEGAYKAMPVVAQMLDAQAMASGIAVSQPNARTLPGAPGAYLLGR
ncbi:acyltransferase family protein [Pseudomonas typographi]|uniref:acyltransferase family protein n=1 Tax=Pseudomonas typographi TaxID=2715964 RepID=UPI001685F8BE|nr:acyltransferase family protein [Pseudomonas typographi]MBD1551978.1 acyltransferase [Pseudomonas typographi]